MGHTPSEQAWNLTIRLDVNLFQYMPYVSIWAWQPNEILSSASGYGGCVSIAYTTPIVQTSAANLSNQTATIMKRILIDQKTKAHVVCHRTSPMPVAHVLWPWNSFHDPITFYMVIRFF